MQRVIRFQSSPYVASYTSNNKATRQQFKHDDVKKAFDKLINDASYEKTIEKVARRTDICRLNNMERRGNWQKIMHCVNFRVFDSPVAPPEKQ